MVMIMQSMCRAEHSCSGPLSTFQAHRRAGWELAQGATHAVPPQAAGPEARAAAHTPEDVLLVSRMATSAPMHTAYWGAYCLKRHLDGYRCVYRACIGVAGDGAMQPTRERWMRACAP